MGSAGEVASPSAHGRQGEVGGKQPASARGRRGEVGGKQPATSISLDDFTCSKEL